MTHTDTIPSAQPETAAGAGAAVRPPRSRLAPPASIAGEPLRRLLLISCGLLCVAMTLVFIAVARGPELSIVDEPVHAGYLYTLSHGEIPAKGTLIPTEIRYEWYCHDEQAKTGAAHCTGFTKSWQRTAQEYTFGDPPVYYAVTGVLVRAISPLVPGGHNFIDIARGVGALWLFAAMIVLYFAARRFRISWPYALAAALLLPLCPGVLASTSEVTSDAPAALCGALALLALARLTIDKRMGLILPFVLTVLTTGTKQLNGTPMLAVAAVALGISALTFRRDRDLRAALRPCLVAVSILAGFLITFLGWDVFQNHRGVKHWVNPNAVNGMPLTGSKAGDFLSNLFGTFQHLTTSFWLQPQISGESVVIWATLLCLVFCSAPVAAMVASRSWSSGWLLGAGTLAGISAIPLAVELQVYMANHEYFQVVSARYAISFLPWTILCLAVVAHRRRLLRTTQLFVTFGLLVMVLAELHVVNLGTTLGSHTGFIVG
jgi:hypothetical protein